jgi:hypothetical protein
MAECDWKTLPHDNTRVPRSKILSKQGHRLDSSFLLDDERIKIMTQNLRSRADGQVSDIDRFEAGVRVEIHRSDDGVVL